VRRLRFHKGREEQLDEANGQEGLLFERALRIALAKADGWVFQQADGWVFQQDALNRLRGLCSSNWCTQEVKEWLSKATQPVEIRIMAGSGGFRDAIAQYETQSDEQLRRKIQQSPTSKVFRLVPLASVDNRARTEVEQIVRSAGYSLVPQ
jgi:hypothetical protein